MNQPNQPLQKDRPWLARAFRIWTTRVEVIDLFESSRSYFLRKSNHATRMAKVLAFAATATLSVLPADASAQWDSSSSRSSSFSPPSSNLQNSNFGKNLPSLTDDTIFWAKTEFTIPFHVDGSGKQPSEVQLEVSSDNGRNWETYARDNVNSRQFRFAARSDGLYLFRIKTIDDFGKAFDPGGEPLKVLVDTQSPELRLSVDSDAQGRLVAEFVIQEPNPKSDWIRLEYQSDVNDRWTSIPFGLHRDTDNQTTGTGKWDIPANTRQIAVRLVVRDAAGNESEVTRLPQLPKLANAGGSLQFASGPSSATSMVPSYPSLGSSSNNKSNKDSSSKSIASNAQPAAQKPPTTSPSKSSININKSGKYTFHSIEKEPKSTAPVGPGINASLAKEANGSVLVDNSNDPLYLDSPSNNLSQSSPVHERSNAASPGRSASSRTSLELPESELHTTQGTDLAPVGNATSPHAKPYYSKSKAFSLDYEVDSQASSSMVASVELWGTTDGGQTWDMWGTDPDGRTPFDIKVETEGLFGFRMVIVGANGLASNRPRNGDNADAWIHVDTQTPTAVIESALYGRGNESGSLIIDYVAKDDHFGDRPIALAYSELPTGPWTTIATGLKNSGRYAWPADPNLPRRIYLKIAAFDEAGNVGESQLDIPIDVEGLAPRGRIQGFRPIVGQ